MPFFQPLLAELYGREFNPKGFASTVSETYGWNFSSDIVEELIPRFAEHGWLEKVAVNGGSAAYSVSLNESGEFDVAESELSERLGEIVDQFFEFLNEISPLSSYTKTRAEFSDVLVEWLVSIDAYNESILRENAVVKAIEGQLAIYQELPDGSQLSSEDKYLCARFVKHLFEAGSNLVSELCEIASAGLLTEVVRDFNKPVTQVDQSDLAIYLDSSLALELIGVSGKSGQENVRSVIEGAQAIGCVVRVFSFTLEEMQRVLDAVLKRPIPNRTGPTADALRRNETEEAYVREVARNPQPFLEAHGVGIIERDLTQYPNEHEYFNEEVFEACVSKMSWHFEQAPRLHDAMAIAFMMRMRRGNRSRDIFSSRHVFITRNGMLAQMARRFCIDEELTLPNVLPCVIHQRQLATALWLRTGTGINSDEIPRHMMLAACEQVLSIRASIIDKAQQTARSLTPERAKQLDLLLSQDRSVQLLQDKTLSTSRVITSENISELIDLMRNELGVEIKTAAEAEIAEIKKAERSKSRKAASLRRQAENKHSQIESEVKSLRAQDRDLAVGLVENANTKAKKERFMLYAVVVLFLALIAFSGSLVGEDTSDPLRIGVWIITGTLAVIFMFMQLFNLDLGSNKLFKKRSKRLLEKEAERLNADAKLSGFFVGWDPSSRKLVLEDKARVPASAATGASNGLFT
ncbi:MAG: hypothetical protein AAGA97_08180 [Pseudomonadota bacterium]